MRPRAVCHLSQLSDSKFFEAVAEGLRLILDNARRLITSANALHQGKHFHGARIMRALSEEEASKFLILVDAVRCPRQPADRLANQLKRFGDHLAKGLYGEACGMRPTTLGQLQEYLDARRETFYLDGPNDVDWIFRNAVIQKREEVLYVDYVASDEGHYWQDPSMYDHEIYGSILVGAIEPLSVTIASALHEAGVATANGLATVAEIWRPIPMHQDMHVRELWEFNRQTLERLNPQALTQDCALAVLHAVVNDWQFPMYGLNLNFKDVRIELLREQQRRSMLDWQPTRPPSCEKTL